MWYFVWIIAVLLALASGLLAVMWVEVRSRATTSTALFQATECRDAAPGSTQLVEPSP